MKNTFYVNTDHINPNMLI